MDQITHDEEFQLPEHWSLQTHLSLLALWTILNCGPMWYTIYSNKKSRPDPARDAPFQAFTRIDYDQWSYLTALFTHFFFLPRFILGWLSFFFGCIGCWLMCLGDDPYALPLWKVKVIRKICTVSAYCTLGLAGVWGQKKRIDVDYSRFLGPSYRKTYDGAGIFVQNHLHTTDVLMSWLLMAPQAGFLGKREALKVPLTQYIVGPLEFMLVGRDTKDSKEVRQKLVQDILDRQVKAEKEDTIPLAIYPEGATTNGTSLIEFKKGAFGSLRKVKPHVQTFQTLTGVRPVHGDAISMLAAVNVLFHCGLTLFTIYEMPVFEPNEFFWQNHWQEGKEEKWQAYARAVRELMAEVGDLELSKCSMEDKLAYKKLIRNQSTKQD